MVLKPARLAGDGGRQGYGYGTAYPTPVAPATYGTSATYGRQGYVDDTASAYAMEAGAAIPAYDDATGMPLATDAGAGTDQRRMPTVSEAETTYAPQVGTPRSEDRR